MADSWITKNKGAVPWVLEPQQNKYGYINNSRWATPISETAEEPQIWNPNQVYVANDGESIDHSPCGHWHKGPSTYQLAWKWKKQFLYWKVDGSKWTGKIVTIGLPGSDKDYTSVKDAFQAATSDALYLIDPGIYQESPDINLALPAGSFNFYIKGLGETADDTVINIYGSLYLGLHWNWPYHGSGHHIFENIKVVSTSSGGGVAINIGDESSTISAKINKCHLYGKYPLAYDHGGYTSGYFELINTYIEGHTETDGVAFKHLVDLDLSKILLNKASYNYDSTPSGGGIINNNGLLLFYCTNSLELDDKATESTPGYGFNYGEDLIVEVSTMVRV